MVVEEGGVEGVGGRLSSVREAAQRDGSCARIAKHLSVLFMLKTKVSTLYEAGSECHAKSQLVAGQSHPPRSNHPPTTDSPTTTTSSGTSQGNCASVETKALDPDGSGAH